MRRSRKTEKEREIDKERPDHLGKRTFFEALKKVSEEKDEH